MSENNSGKQQFLLGLLGGIAVISVVGLIIVGVAFFNVSKGNNGQVAGQNEQNANTAKPQMAAQNQAGPGGSLAQVSGVKTFSEKPGAQICREGGKPVVYLFSTTWCPHCQWIKSTFDQVVKQYADAGKIKAYHWDVDINDNTLTAEKESKTPDAALAIYKEFNPEGSIPTFVFGCKYYRVGNGYEAQQDLNAEKAEFEALIADLTK